jgi:hypothetical protein
MRGQSALSKLPHTDAFTNHCVLSVADRMLILFLLIVLADEHGRLTTLHQRLATVAAGDNDHWAAGRPVDKLPNSTAKWLGKAAIRRPRWDRIEEFLRLQVPREHLPVVRATAAGLYCEAAGVNPPSRDFLGPVYLPPWAQHTRATTETIIADVAATLAPRLAPEAHTGAASAAAGDLAPVENPELRAVLAERDKYKSERDGYKTVLDQVVREYRAVQEENAALREQVTYWDGAVTVQGEQFVEFHRQRQDVRLLNRQLQALRKLHIDLLLKLHPGLAVTTVELIVDEQLDPATVMTRRTNWEFTSPAVSEDTDVASDAATPPAAAGQ